MNNLKIELEPRVDENQQVYYVGKLNAPVKIDCSQGVAFLVFLSDQGAEELQIAFTDNEGNFTDPYQSKGRTKLKLERRKDRDQKTFYLAKLKTNGILDCSEEPVSFLIFTSKLNSEMLQIGAPLVLEHIKRNKKKIKSKQTNESYLISETYVESTMSDEQEEKILLGL